MKRQLPVVVWGVLLSLVMVACTPAGLTFDEASFRFTYNQNGWNRGGAIHIPTGIQYHQNVSLVVGLHGANSDGASFRAMGFDRVADELDFIMVYPDGGGGRWDNPNEIQFLQQLISAFQEKYHVDTQRTYITGHSAGAIFAYKAALVLGRQISAIAPVAGLMEADEPQKTPVPVSVLHLHAVDDDVVPFAGDTSWGYLSAIESINVWKKINRATDSGLEFYKDKGIVGTIWKGPQADTALLRYETGHHSWLPKATALIADFFYNHPARATTLVLRNDVLPPQCGLNDQLKLAVRLSKPDLVEKVSYFMDAIPVGESSVSPFNYPMVQTTIGIHRFSAVASLKNGQTVASTINPSVLVTKTAAGLGTVLPISAIRSSSDEKPELSARCAVDSDLTTRWSSAFADNQELVLDLGQSRTIQAVSLNWEVARAASYTIDASEDGKTWQTIVKNDAGFGDFDAMEFTPIDTRYVRFHGLTRATEYGFSLWEVMVYGK